MKSYSKKFKMECVIPKASRFKISNSIIIIIRYDNINGIDTLTKQMNDIKYIIYMRFIMKLKKLQSRVYLYGI